MMKDFWRKVVIGLKTFISASFDYDFIHINGKYPQYIKQFRKFSIVLLSLLAVGFLIVAFGNDSALHLLFIIFGICFAATIIYSIYVFFAIWRKLYKERMEKENKK